MDLLTDIPELSHHICALHGSAGQKWLNDLPEHIQNLKQKWHLEKLVPVSNMTYHCVLMGMKEHLPIILKIGFSSLMGEKNALRAFAHKGAPILYESTSHALLIERAHPGTSLRCLFPDNDQTATDHFCDLYQTLHSTPFVPRGPFPNLSFWLRVLSKDYSCIPHSFLVKARTLSTFLTATTTTPCLLHGDLHHDNILSHENAWMIIDPKGVIGDPVYEIAPFVRNPLPELFASDKPHVLIQRRIERLINTLGLTPERLLGWLFVDAILSWIWCLEDHVDPFMSRAYAHIIWDQLSETKDFIS